MASYRDLIGLFKALLWLWDGKHREKTQGDTCFCGEGQEPQVIVDIHAYVHHAGLL